MPESKGLAVKRLIALIEQVADEEGRRDGVWGWLTKTSDRTGIDKSKIGRLLRGGGVSEGVSPKTLEKVQKKMGILPAYFHDPCLTPVDYRKHLLSTPPRLRLLKRSEPLYPAAWERWISGADRELTAAEYNALARLPFSNRDPKPYQYDTILSMMRQMVGTARAMSDEEDTDVRRKK